MTLEKRRGSPLFHDVLRVVRHLVKVNFGQHLAVVVYLVQSESVRREGHHVVLAGVLIEEFEHFGILGRLRVFDLDVVFVFPLREYLAFGLLNNSAPIEVRDRVATSETPRKRG
ncbi:hypothetical protein JCM18750_11230 [Halostagnicola bangensis]